MKAKELKVLRKKIEKADRIKKSPLTDLVGRTYNNNKFCLQQEQTTNDDNSSSYHVKLLSSCGISSNTCSMDEKTGHVVTTTRMNDNDDAIADNLSLFSFNKWQEINPSYWFDEMMELFHMNMSELYKQSSWGLNMEEKKEELQHHKARFLIVSTKTTNSMMVTPPAGTRTTSKENLEENQNRNEISRQFGNEKHQTTTSTTNSTSTTTRPSSSSLVAFCHYRFEYDNDEFPSCAVLYLYEIQVSQRFQSLGIGTLLMELLYCIAQQMDMSKIMLTVFQSNHDAREFYRTKLQYDIDVTSPNHDDNNNDEEEEEVDYEILSKVITTTQSKP